MQLSPNTSATLDVEHDAELMEIRRFIECDYVEAANSNSAARYSSLYTPDALWSPPRAPDRRGPAAIRFAFVAKQADIHIKMNFQECGLFRPQFGFATALVEVHVEPFDTTSGEGTEDLIYRALWHLRKDGGVWKICRQIFTEKPRLEFV
ncbi:DUF4440 domain-containing protein [Trinickia caryophylli]|uniref:Ketosteroid isomerase homolog n=1 Tax=Trinickia caryophylli TaxID=28094 RepID=A0A1X7FKI4_TRICW|nr:DUF4440 domain-containing protein [Trinickia caryophylli]PMS13200.1 DUF4440 domain-containing protein [Trinickia caryophylli]TRX19274.1 DUF4440 domain-containing protein [Trinickia caryophylli]WQE13423.1 DUF4440 domain-containing protein [Trinickia caryophylli]SMF53125.1 Ketosteroid isomerase homolog [Trinickia caryophylli]GLU34054.1 hypothetical protein Busp01_38960 [Trinickia caryophylli]